MGNMNSWVQFILYFVVILLITKPLGLYLCRVLDVDGKTFLDPVVKPIEKLIYKLLGIDPKKELHTPEGRPVAILNEGGVIDELYS